ncbi:hypothetical protein [Flammeovirga aprica]|uniref:Outer membrane protein beta-barrel domain-containing protein n=1 Tax=Flammeovirga aprica JL-4 TaxID=694437 RepID=A0A7X9RYE8_9BACT|nr:hypothetical protein [Flammeovirga aprica]NME71072.1 hypothetical protein [Flammeovirga aprica JL-4]
MKHKLLLITFIIFYSIGSNAQDLALHHKVSEKRRNATDYSSEMNSSYKDSIQSKTTNFFIAYDLGEAVFNQFKSLGGEAGIRFKNDHLLRLAFTYLYLSEKHLSSDFAKAVDGKNVKGKQVGFEFFYDFPVFTKGLYIAPSFGYYDHEYTHTVSNEKLQKSSFTVGSAISFVETDVLKIKGLYYRVSLPLRFTLDPIQDTQLGDTTVKNNRFDNSIWFFVGFQF